jgi:hypothetical protein
MKHPADWDNMEYVRQQPVMQQLQQAAQMSGSAASSTSQFVGPFEATLTHRMARGLDLTGIPLASILQSLKCDEAPHTVVLQERVRWCLFPYSAMAIGRAGGYVLHVMACTFLLNM